MINRFLLLFAAVLSAIVIVQIGCSTSSIKSQELLNTLNESKLDEIDLAVNECIHDGNTPGGIFFLHIEKPNNEAQLEWVQVYGNKSLSPNIETNSVDTIYDLASLTKVVATAPSIMMLWERGLLDIDAPAFTYLPAFTNDLQKTITIRHLLTHTSGLRPGYSTKGWKGYDEGIATACKELPKQEPGSKFVYSDINFILLGEIVRTVSGEKIDKFAKENIYLPLGMIDTGYNPSSDKLSRIAPTQKVNNKILCGVVHDPTARNMDGIAGHAGVFSTVSDLSIYCNMLLHQGRYGKKLKKQLLKPETVHLMATIQSPKALKDKRSLGWDVATGYSSPRGNIFPAGESFGHTGFTGTSMWILPNEGIFYIFLSNRVHPDGKGNVLGLQRILGTKVAEMKGIELEQQN